MGGSDFRPGFDERREVFRLLGHLDARGRVGFLGECCKLVSAPGVETRVIESDGTVDAVYWDLCLLAFDRGLDLSRIGERLVRWVRRCGIDPGTRDRPSVGVPVTAPAG